MVSKHEQPLKDSADSDLSVDSSSASTPDLEDSSEPKVVVWQRSISGSVKARISDIESQAQKREFSPTFVLPKASSLDRPPSCGSTGEPERCLAVKSRLYRPHHSAQLLRSKTMPSVLLQNADGTPNETTNENLENPTWSISAKRAIFTPSLRTSWPSPRATSIDEGSQNIRYNSFESMGISKSTFPTGILSSTPLRRSFNGGINYKIAPPSAVPSLLEKSNGWPPKENYLRPEPTTRMSRSLTPECLSQRPPLVRQIHAELSTSLETVPPNITPFPVSRPLLTLDWDLKLENLKRKFPFINEKTVFKMSLEKKSRGLGIGICGGRELTTTDNWSSIFIRIKRLYPLQPALESGQLKIGDIILRVNEHYLTDLSHHEAVEALRVASGSVFLMLCRPPPGVLPPLPMEFEVELEKCGGGLGFTLVNDLNAHDSGHFVKDLVRDPALSDGRVQPGDQILMVNDVDLKGLSHEETIQCLRNSPPVVKLLLCRPLQTPPSSPPTNPTVEDCSRQDKKTLRKEAKDLLSDKTRRKSFESNSNSNCSSNGRRQRLKGNNNSNGLSVDSAGDQSTPSNSDIESRRNTPTPTDYFRVPNVRSFLSQEALDAVDLQHSSLVQPSSFKPTFLNLEHKNLDSYKIFPEKIDLSPGSVPSLHVSAWEPQVTLGNEESLNNRQTSSEAEIAYVNGNDSDSFHLGPSFRRVSSCDVVPGGLSHSTPKEDFSSIGLKKWRGTALENGHVQESKEFTDGFVKQTAWEMMVIQLNKQRNDRLGFTLLAVEIGNLKGSFVKNIHPGSLANEDGRLKVGDHLLKINGFPTANLPNSDVIEILRNQHGKISLEIARHPVVSNMILNLIQLSLV